MNFKKILISGIKVVASIVAGAAVFLGISKLVENTKTTKVKNGSEEVNPLEETNTEDEKIKKVVTGFRSAQDVFGKVFILFQSLTTLIENISRVFGNESSAFQPSFNQGYNPGWAYNQQIVVDPDGKHWTRRVSPFVTEVGTCNPQGYYNNGCPF